MKNPLEFIVGVDIHFSAALLGCIKNNYNVLIESRHGTAKTTLARILGNIVGDMGIYRAQTESILSMVGMPNPSKLAQGIFEYTPHSRSIFNKDAIFIDELARAPYETQNIFLEILEERSINGFPLNKLKFIIACMNPTTYEASNEIDDALLDRFMCVLKMPENQRDISPKIINDILDIEHNIDYDYIREVLSNIDKQDEPNKYKITQYISNVTEEIRRIFAKANTDNSLYISPRTYGNHLCKLITIMYKTYRAMSFPKDLSLKYAYKYGIKFVYENKIKIDSTVVNSVVTNEINALFNNTSSMKTRPLFNSQEECISYVSENINLLQDIDAISKAKIYKIFMSLGNNKSIQLNDRNVCDFIKFMSKEVDDLPDNRQLLDFVEREFLNQIDQLNNISIESKDYALIRDKKIYINMKILNNVTTV